MSKIEEKDPTGNPRIKRACLEIERKIYPIYDGINTIGRNPNAVINIKNINVSQHHAVIVVIDENKHFLSDIKSSNGTFLNYNQLQPLSLYQLNDNDVIKFGNLITVYRRNDANLDISQTDTVTSQTISQSFYTASTQDAEIVNDFHEMDTQVFDNNEPTDFHDLPTQVENFDLHKNTTVELENNKENASGIDLPLTENIQIGELHLSEVLTENPDDFTNQNLEEKQINDENQELEIVNGDRINEELDEIVERDVASTDNLQNEIVDDNDTSNDSLVFINKQNFDHEHKNDQENKSDVVEERSIEKTTENNDDSSNESLDLVTMQKVAQIQNNSDTVLELTQQIKPVVLANTSRRISDSDDVEFNKNQHIKKRCIISDDETDIEDNDVDDNNQSNLIPTTQMNQSDIIPATQHVVNEDAKQTTDVIEDSFEDSSFALEMSDKVFEISDPNKADDDIFNQPTQQLNINLIEKHRINNKNDELYVEATQKIENNSDKIVNSDKQDLEVDIDDGNNSIIKDNSSDHDLFALPVSPKKQKRSKIDPKPSTSKDVEDELQDLFATQQQNLTCSQLVHILADSPTKQTKIQIVNNNYINNNSCEIQQKSTEKIDTIIKVDDRKLEEELGTLFQSQADFTCSQLVQILDDPKDVKTPTISDSLITGTDNKDNTVTNLEIDEEKRIVNDVKTNNTITLNDETKAGESVDKCLKKKFTKMASDKEIEISESARLHESETVKNTKIKSKKRSNNSKTDSQSSIGSTSSEDYFVGKSRSNSKKRQNLDLSTSSSTSKRKVEFTTTDHIEHPIRRTTRQSLKHSNDSNSNSQSSIDSASNDDLFNTSTISLRNRKKSSIKNDSNEEVVISKSLTDNGKNVKRKSRKRSINSEENSNIPTKIRLDENTNILKVDHDTSISKATTEKNVQSSVSTDLSTSQITETSTTIQKNKMSRRTRKNPNNTTIQLLPVTVIVPRKDENTENEQKPSKVSTRGRPPKKNNESILTPSDSSASSSSSSTTVIRKGKRRLSANSRSMKKLEKIQEYGTVTKTVKRKCNSQQNTDEELEQSTIDRNNETISTPERSRRKLKPKVVFTMMDNPELESLIRQLGGMIVDSVDACTVLVTEHVKRSCKLLSAVGQGKPICSPQWLLDSKKAYTFLDPWDYILKDNEAEEKWNFKLHESLERSNRKKLMENYTFQLFVNQAADVLKGAIESCGGKCVTRYSPKNCNSNFVIVANPGNRSKYNKIIKQNPDILVVAPEAIFDGVLRQELQFERHLL